MAQALNFQPQVGGFRVALRVARDRSTTFQPFSVFLSGHTHPPPKGSPPFLDETSPKMLSRSTRSAPFLHDVAQETERRISRINHIPTMTTVPAHPKRPMSDPTCRTDFRRVNCRIEYPATRTGNRRRFHDMFFHNMRHNMSDPQLLAH